MSTKIWSIMICEVCLVVREERDFFKESKICYKCIYKQKLSIANEGKPRNYCKVCAKEVFFDKEAKKRQRNVFCSPECAKKGHKQLLKDHWTKQLKRNPATKVC